MSEPLREKGKLRFFACGDEGRHALVRLDREETEVNSAFSVLERGDVIEVDVMRSTGEGKRVGKNSKIELKLSAKRLDLG